MSEADVIAATREPVTQARIAGDLRALGAAPGMVLLVHTALSKLGWVCGGPEAVILALTDTLGRDGTLAMPCFTAHLSDPASWEAPPVPETWWPVLRETMTPFDPRTTPSRQVGAVAETFRSWPGVRRSSHPLVSFCARGPLAATITRDHPLEEGFGNGSPLARLYEADAHILLLGVGFAHCTAFHLGEHRAGIAPLIDEGAPLMRGGTRIWQVFQAPDYDSDDFEACGAAFEARSGAVRCAMVAQAPARLMRLRAAADFAQSWLPQHRG